MQCATMNRRTLTMNWDGLGEEDFEDDHFFESCNRISSVVPLDLASSGSDDDNDFEDSRMSFVSAISSASIKSICSYEPPITKSSSILASYDMWMSEPGDIRERRKRLLQGMGLSSTKDMLRLASAKITKAVSKKPDNEQIPTLKEVVENNSSSSSSSLPPPPPPPSSSSHSNPTAAIVLVRSRSDGDIYAMTKQRKEELIGPLSKQRLTRTSSGLQIPSIGTVCHQYSNGFRMKNKLSSNNPSNDMLQSDGAFFLIKNLDTGKEFIVKEYNEQGMWNKLSDVETGKQLTMEEFEKSVGYSPVVKELMRRARNNNDNDDDEEEEDNNNNNNGRKLNSNSYFTKSFRNSKRKGAAFLKNIKGVATSMSGLNKELHELLPEAPKVTSQWVKARQHGKSYKEFTALHMSQDIQAHQGSIWSIRFSSDARYLASAGEDKVIHVWEVQECEVMSTRAGGDHDLLSSATSGTPVHPMMAASEITPERHVVDWTDLHEMVTAVTYTPDGQGAVIGSHQGICRFYSIDDCKLEHLNDVQVKIKSQTKKLPGFQSQAQAKKITGFQFAPWNPSEVLITSTDSRIRIYNGPELIQKYRGFRNTSSQISASFSPDGKHVISASEDSQVYIWKVEESKNPGGGKRKSRITVQAHEHFPCKDVSVAIPWPGSTKNEPPTVEIHSKRHSKRSTATPTLEDSNNNNNNNNNNNAVGLSSRRHLPPLPKKNNALERIASCTDEDFGQSGRIDPGIGVSDSFGSSSASISYGDSPSISASSTSPSQSWSSSFSLFDNGGGHGGQTVQATAWGLVIVTASLEGEIRVYQNFGLPLKVGRQANIFRD